MRNTEDGPLTPRQAQDDGEDAKRSHLTAAEGVSKRSVMDSTGFDVVDNWLEPVSTSPVS